MIVFFQQSAIIKMCCFGFLTPLHFVLHLSLCKVWGLYNYFPPTKYIPPLPLAMAMTMSMALALSITINMA